MNRTKTIILGILFVAIAMITGVTFALWQTTLTQQSTNIITSGCFKVELTDENPITLGNAYPITDVEGSSLTPYTFTITNTCNSLVGYQVNLEVLNPSDLLRTDYVKAKLNDGIPLTLSSDHQVVKTLENARSSYGMEVGSLGANETKTFQLRLWLDENTPASDEVMDKTLNSKVTITLAHEKDMYADNSLNGANPVISEGLVPVTIDANGTVHKADTSKEWYNYTNKEWANAVILKDESMVYEKNEVIPEENIKQYYVWIPRYRYQLWNVTLEESYPNGKSSENAINIVFEGKNTEKSTGTNNGEWLTHPAFTTFDTNGIWVGKFETSYDEETYTNNHLFTTTNPNYENATNGKNIIIKPNVRSLTFQTVSEIATLSKEASEELNSHMMKNSEWGAVTYLTYSLYGKCTEESCEEVYINNVNTGYYPAEGESFTGQWEKSGSITGCSAASASASAIGNRTNCEVGYEWNGMNNKASTTGNITGIYDMNGGSWEYVMAVLKNETGDPMSGISDVFNSAFNGLYGCPSFGASPSILEKKDGKEFPNDSRYYDTYHANSFSLCDDTYYQYQNGHLGDATKEIASSKESDPSAPTGLWFTSKASFPTFHYPWFIRGGDFDGGTNIAFHRAGGNAHRDYGARVVLAY